MKEKEKLLDGSQEILFTSGFYKTTMDDIASSLKMSKKTIYKYFPSKSDLVMAVANHFTKKMERKIIPIIESDKNAVEKLSELIALLSKTAGKIGDRLLGELRSNYPEVWKHVDGFRTEMMYGNITKVYEQGKAEGLFLDYPTPIVMNIFVNAVRTTVNPEFIINNNFSVVVAAQTTFKIIIGGVLTEKGKKIFDKSFNKEAI
ncbi:MAG: transcriptional regulator TetR family [Ignavibacteria bacterium]|nr:MAG: transcriptional regulator TetR family [Ignavibacteria bacterium]KAF0161608.1 MAG: transcriptional regulator TetR family [Ignavibacteria bacterium]